jgi:hypothetical protein
VDLFIYMMKTIKIAPMKKVNVALHTTYRLQSDSVLLVQGVSEI